MESFGNLSTPVHYNSVGLDEYASDRDLASVPLFKDYPDSLLKFASISCMVFMMIGIPGNLVTIIALARCKKVRNATAYFIINLSFSDLLFCCFVLPLASSTFWHRSWPHGKILCHMFPYARYALVAVSIFTVLAITINRYILISHPSLYPKLYKKLYLSLMIASIWLFSFGFFVVTCLGIWGQYSLDPVTGSCTIIPDKNDRSPKKFVFIVAFLIPSLAIVLCYARILWIVRKTTQQSRPAIHTRLTEMTLAKSTVSVNRPHDIDAKRQPKDRPRCFNCFVNPGVEFSSSSDEQSCAVTQEIQSTPESNSRVLGNETARNFRQSFIASMRWTTSPRKPLLPTKKDKKLLTMIVAIMVSFFVCHLPITLTKTIYLEISSNHAIANILGYVLIYFTTCINPIIYVVMSNEYRQAYKKLFQCR